MGTVSERVVPYLLFSIPLNLNEDKYLGKFDTRPNSVKNAEVFGSILGGMVGFSVGSGITQIGSNAVKNSYRSLTNTNVSIMTKTESAIAKQGAIYLEEKNGVWEATNNATPSIFKNKPALLPKTSTATTIKEVYKKTATRKEEPHSTVVKTSTKKESTETTSTGKTSSKSSTTGKETSRIIITDSSKETETEIRNIGDFATIKIEKTNSEIPSAYMIDGMTKGGKEKTSGIGSGSYFESYRGGKTSGKESGYSNNDEGYKFNGNSGSSGNGNSSNSSKNQDSYYEGRKIYTGSELNQRDVTKANEVTKDVQHSTNINVESQTIEYATNPTKFKEDLEVAILEGKATGETVLKTIENLVNGGKEDIGDPERRSLNEIKEAVIRVKTAPEMNLIATGDLNSQEVLNTLKINGIEKFNPDDPDLPENVRARLDEVRRNGGEIEAFYDKTTNKIFINENVEDGETRALVAREWKISEDLKDGKGKANDEGQLKATVAGELAYDDMMKRAGEGKTGSISTDDLNVGVMDANSKVTSDKVLEVKPEDLKAWSSAIGQVDGPYPFLDMVDVALNGVAWLMENNSRIKSSTKNERKVNDKAYEQAKKDYEKAKSEYEELKSRPNKTPKDKQERDKAKNKMEKALERMRKSENHSRIVQGQKSKRGGNKK